MKRRIAFVLLAMVASVTVASPAHGHAGDAAEDTNYRSTIDRVEPDIDGLDFSIVAGNQVQLRNTTDREILVLGYQQEPYLRIGPDGIFTNRRSPATYLNRTAEGDVEVPDFASSAAEPEWQREGGGDTASWHDHRVHWMSEQQPPAVARDPSVRQVVVPDWTVVSQYGDQRVVVTGELVWIPPPPALPWYVVAAVAFALGVVAPFLGRRSLLWMLTMLAALIVVDIVHVAGISIGGGGAGANLGSVFETALPAAVAWATGIYGIRRLLAGTDDGVWLALFSSFLIAVLGGLAGLSELNYSQINFAFPPALARFAVAFSLGGGFGTAAAAGVLLARQRRLLIEAIEKPS